MRDDVFDLHTHHDRCGHAVGGLRDYIEAAIAVGADTIGLSDHTPFWGADEDAARPWVAMACSEYPRYVAEAMRLRDEYAGRIDVLVAAESDYFPEWLPRYSDRLAEFPLDYVIGSVHVLDGVDIFRPERWIGCDDDASRREVARRYYRLVEEAARCGKFDVIGHVDALKAVCPDISRLRVPEEDDMLRSIARSGAVMEVNTSGKTKACGGWYPTADMLERAFRLGVRVTFASDAHTPERVGDDFHEVARVLWDIGYREWFTFKKRRPVARPLVVSLAIGRDGATESR